jgi:hypothetical protein
MEELDAFHSLISRTVSDTAGHVYIGIGYLSRSNYLGPDQWSFSKLTFSSESRDCLTQAAASGKGSILLAAVDSQMNI